MRNRFTLVLLILELCFITASGDVSVKNPKSGLLIDTSVIEVRQLNSDEIAGFRNQKDFNYGSSYQSADSLWNRFWKGFWRLIESIFADKISNNAVKLISLLALSILIIFIILKFSGISLFHLINKTPVPVTHLNSDQATNIHEINFDVEIASAMQSEQYRMAIRMHYLKTLKQLSDKNLISWSIDKTNFEYVYEIEHPKHKQEFKVLTQNFEYVWYGELNLNHTAFTEMQEEYMRFNNLLLERS